MEIRVKISIISIFSLYFWFSNDFIGCLDFTRILASITTGDDITN